MDTDAASKGQAVPIIVVDPEVAPVIERRARAGATSNVRAWSRENVRGPDVKHTLA